MYDKINNLKLQKRGYFKNYKLNLISKDEFIRFGNLIDSKIKPEKDKLNNLKFRNTRKSKPNILTKEFLNENIDYIMVDNNKILEVKFKNGISNYVK